jgi:hypothetical protein
MRRTLIALAVTGSLVLIAGCGDGDGNGGSAAAFCSDFQKLQDDMANVDTNDQEAIDEGFRRLEELDPPEEIADEYRQIVELAKDANDAAQDIDLGNAEDVAKTQQEFAQREQELEAASQKVDDFLTNECGIDAAETDSSDAGSGGQ